MGLCGMAPVLLMPAAAALPDMPSECGSPARGHRAHHAPLHACHVMRTLVVLSEPPEDIPAVMLRMAVIKISFKRRRMGVLKHVVPCNILFI